MKKIGIPAVDDNGNLVSICGQKLWSGHQSVWRGAYQRYRSTKGNPWVNKPISTQPDISNDLYNLYDSRKGSGYIKRIRDTKDLGCCPVCGSTTTGSVDHYLPRRAYPEFSIFAPNLVPACTNCNSSSKGTKIKGKKRNERFIHPYFDKLADEELWRVTFEPEFSAVGIGYEPLPGLSWKDRRRVQFHLDNVLGKQFYLAMENEWGNLRFKVGVEARKLAPTPMTGSFVVNLAAEKFEDYSSRGRKNSWYAAFYRGMKIDKDATDWIALNPM